MRKDFLEIKNVDFTIGGKIKLKNASFSIENEGLPRLRKARLA